MNRLLFASTLAALCLLFISGCCPFPCSKGPCKVEKPCAEQSGKPCHTPCAQEQADVEKK